MRRKNVPRVGVAGLEACVRMSGKWSPYTSTRTAVLVSGGMMEWFLSTAVGWRELSEGSVRFLSGVGYTLDREWCPGPCRCDRCAKRWPR